MTARRIGVLHPGEMGSVVAATLVNSGHEVYWASEGRGPNTEQRAEALKLFDALSIPNLCDRCEAIVSVCPPEFADSVADEVLAANFGGLFIDANAISPDRVRKMEARLTPSGIRFVDGGIFGRASTPTLAHIYFSGDWASEADALFGSAGPMKSSTMPGQVGQASALKMCFAAYNKGFTALLAATLSVADQLGVLDTLQLRVPPGTTARIEEAAPKAWRFIPEMHEIAETFASAGVPGAFPKAAAQIYQHLAQFKDRKPELDEILAAIDNRIVATK